MQALLDFSRFAVNTMYVSVLVLLVAGVAAGFMAGLWGKGWIWAAIVLLLLMFAAMYDPPTTYQGKVLPARK